jgi:DUF1680 family protein
MTDAATLLDDTKLATTVDALWQDVTSKRITGGLGSDGRTEAFGADYACRTAPTRRRVHRRHAVYHRMFLREGDAKCHDTFDGRSTTVSLRRLARGRHFYQNPLVSNGTVERSAYSTSRAAPPTSRD